MRLVFHRFFRQFGRKAVLNVDLSLDAFSRRLSRFPYEGLPKSTENKPNESLTGQGRFCDRV